MISNFSNKRMYISKNQIQLYLFSVSTILTTLNALPLFIGSNVYRSMMMAMWLATFLFNMIMYKIILTKTSVLIITLTAVFTSYCAIMYMIYGNGYLNGSYFYTVLLSVFMFVNVHFIHDTQMDRVLNSIITLFNMSSLIVIVYVYLNNFYGVNYLGSLSYLYGSKNSLGPIIVANYLSLLLKKSNSKISKIINAIYMLFLVYMLLLINNRAGVVQLIATIVIYIIFMRKHKGLNTSNNRNWLSMKLMINIASVVSGVVLLYYLYTKVPMVNNFFLWTLKLDKISHLDDFSSGRLFLYELAINNAVKISPLFGVGRWYVDLFYLSVLAELGLFGSLPLFSILIIILHKIKKAIKTDIYYIKLMCLLGLQLLVAGFFEGYPPFGPGSVTFLFWILFGAGTSLKL